MAAWIQASTRFQLAFQVAASSQPIEAQGGDKILLFQASPQNRYYRKNYARLVFKTPYWKRVRPLRISPLAICQSSRFFTQRTIRK
jgi:hypothetical protein